MSTLVIKNLHVKVKEKEILKGINFTFNDNETVALLGPNGNGKSTLLQTIMGNPKYEITEGSIELDEKNITELEVDERSKLGIFLGMQYPSEVPGVNNADFLKASMNAHLEKPMSLFKFYKELNVAYEKMEIPFEMASRNLNEGFSGGEKKKNEILQMLLLNPKFVLLDEIDSGLDVDAIQTVAKVIKSEQSGKRGFLVVSHYARLYNLIEVDKTVILVNGKIVLSGGPELVGKIDKEGYTWLKNDLGIEIENKENMNQVSIGTCATKEALKNK